MDAPERLGELIAELLPATEKTLAGKGG